MGFVSCNSCKLCRCLNSVETMVWAMCVYDRTVWSCWLPSSRCASSGGVSTATAFLLALLLLLLCARISASCRCCCLCGCVCILKARLLYIRRLWFCKNGVVAARMCLCRSQIASKQCCNMRVKMAPALAPERGSMQQLVDESSVGPDETVP